ncbi:hypothetical protein EHYA_09950 [Embleya hyalina]|uniref:Uncharacterized protein n=1 Tax=Embleya hyalina TaxID=516124 RepID=A0A401Z5P6_9ACTN|nr:hypothetical protein EHYA_09950 [Embleya hyalina]
MCAAHPGVPTIVPERIGNPPRRGSRRGGAAGRPSQLPRRPCAAIRWSQPHRAGPSQGKANQRTKTVDEGTDAAARRRSPGSSDSRRHGAHREKGRDPCLRSSGRAARTRVGGAARSRWSRARPLPSADWWRWPGLRRRTGCAAPRWSRAPRPRSPARPGHRQCHRPAGRIRCGRDARRRRGLCERGRVPGGEGAHVVATPAVTPGRVLNATVGRKGPWTPGCPRAMWAGSAGTWSRSPTPPAPRC